MSSDTVKNEIYNFFKDTNQIFRSVVSYITLIEKFSKESEVPLMPINELRSTLFHLYKVVEKPENMNIDLIEAKEHLLRSFYDTYSITSAILLEKIKSTEDKFDHDTISSTYPDFYQEIKPKIISIQAEISDIRTKREITSDSKDKEIIQKLWQNTEYLISTHSLLEGYIPSFNDYQKAKEKSKKSAFEQEKKKVRYDKFLQFIGAVIAGIVIFCIGYFFPKK